MKVHVVIFALLLSGCTSPPPENSPGLSYHDLYNLLEKQSSKGWYDQYFHDFILAHNETWPRLSVKCWPEMTDAGLAGFHLITVINRNGVVVDVRTDTPDFSAECFISGIEKISYPVSPEKYAYIIIAVGEVEDGEI